MIAVTHNGDMVAVQVDRPEARGIIILKECLYGLEVIYPDLSEQSIAHLDLWQSKLPDNGPRWAIHIHVPDSEDAIASFIYRPDIITAFLENPGRPLDPFEARFNREIRK